MNKRHRQFVFIDRMLALLLACIVAPIAGLVALAIAVTMGRPVMFQQERVGLNGKPFTINKFRSMRDPRADEDPGTTDDLRITRLGRFLRKSSLDEIPQLLNIIRGEMRFVGPRPLYASYVPLYNPEQRRRLDVMPGVTGWAQVNGRNALSWEEKFDLDVWYVENHSLLLDAKILLATARKVVQREGISAAGTETAHRFEGTPPR